MQVVLTIYLVAIFMTAGCLVRPVAEGKRLTRIEGDNLTAEQIRANNERAKKTALALIGNACGSALKRSAWAETSAAGDGFFMYMAKQTSCREQYIAIDVQAAVYMAKHNISCSVGADRQLMFNVPGSRSKAEAIQVTCATRLVDLSLSSDAKLRIATFEENGSVYTAQLDTYGNIDSVHNFEGLSEKHLAEFNKLQTDKDNKAQQLMLAGTGLALTSIAAVKIGQHMKIAAALGTAIYGGKTIALAGMLSSGVVIVAYPVAIAAIIGGAVWHDFKKNKEYKNTVLVLREMLRQSLAD